jgi:ribose-phosphate pyrophosphokinase
VILTVFAGRGNYPLAHAVAARLGITPGLCLLEYFPDGEIHVEIQQDILGHDVYLIQPTSPPVADHLLELLLLADACLRAGAGRLTGVVPYFGYARQDRRAHGGEPVGARLLADLLGSRLQRIITVDLHTPAIEGFFTLPVEHLSAVPLLAEALRSQRATDQVIVAPDLGAAKLAQRYADFLDLPVAYVHKIRHSGREVSVRSVIGEIEGRSPILIDDMISTGGTMISAIEALLEKRCRPDITLATSHALLAGPAVARLGDLPVRKILTTDSVPPPTGVVPVEIVSLDKLLAETISRLHGGYG